MTTSDWITIISVIVGMAGTSMIILGRLNKELGVINTKIDWIFAELKNHNKRLRKLEKKLR